MIKNDRQLAATTRQKDVLSGALKTAQAQPDKSIFVKAHIQALRSDIRRLDKEAADYARLKAGRTSWAGLEALDDAGDILIRARIKSKLTQAGLAKLVGTPYQVIQRYERTKYRSASLETVSEVKRALQQAAAG